MRTIVRLKPDLRWNVPLNAGPRAVPALMARAAIRELEESRGAEREAGSNQRERRGMGVDAKVLELALRYQLLSSQTSFVAVEERSAGEQAERAQLRRVPVALTHGWGGSDRLLQVSACYSMAPAALQDLDATLHVPHTCHCTKESRCFRISFCCKASRSICCMCGMTLCW